MLLAWAASRNMKGVCPLVAFSIGVLVNVILGFVLSTQVFGEFWNRLGQ